MYRPMIAVAVCVGFLLSVAAAHARSIDTGTAPGADPALSGSAGGGRTFTLIRVAPISGTNPFDPRRLRSDIAAATGSSPGSGPGGTCTIGALALTSGLPVVPPGAAYIDVDGATGTLQVRGAGAVGASTALVVSLPAMDTTRIALGSAGWQAVSPALPRNFAAGVPPQTFVVKHTASGDFYRVTLGFLGTTTLSITAASGDCCGTGGCP